jgi:hypothetical protein
MSWSPIAVGSMPPRSGHAEVENQGIAAIGIDQPVFGAPAEADDPGRR